MIADFTFLLFEVIVIATTIATVCYIEKKSAETYKQIIREHENNHCS